jgi:uncharacterized protein (DUF2141 family)
LSWSVIAIGCLVLLASCAHRGGGGGDKAPSQPTTAPASAPAAPQIATLFVNVIGLRSGQGQLLVCVFDRPGGFPADTTRALMYQVRPIDHRAYGPIRIGFPLPPGAYAVSVVHDENRNGRLDGGEGLGVTNNADVRVGLPKFANAKVAVLPQGAQVTVAVRYY